MDTTDAMWKCAGRQEGQGAEKGILRGGALSRLQRSEGACQAEGAPKGQGWK